MIACESRSYDKNVSERAFFALGAVAMLGVAMKIVAQDIFVGQDLSRDRTILGNDLRKPGIELVRFHESCEEVITPCQRILLFSGKHAEKACRFLSVIKE